MKVEIILDQFVGLRLLNRCFASSLGSSLDVPGFFPFANLKKTEPPKKQKLKTNKNKRVGRRGLIFSFFFFELDSFCEQC